MCELYGAGRRAPEIVDLLALTVSLTNFIRAQIRNLREKKLEQRRVRRYVCEAQRRFRVFSTQRPLLNASLSMDIGYGVR